MFLFLFLLLLLRSVLERGRYECDADTDGDHGDTFDSGRLAQYALALPGYGGGIRSVADIAMGMCVSPELGEFPTLEGGFTVY